MNSPSTSPATFQNILLSEIYMYAYILSFSNLLKVFFYNLSLACNIYVEELVIFYYIHNVFISSEASIGPNR